MLHSCSTCIQLHDEVNRSIVERDNAMLPAEGYLAAFARRIFAGSYNLHPRSQLCDLADLRHLGLRWVQQNLDPR